MLNFSKVLENNEPSCIYNQDEIGLVYQLLPNVLYLVQEEARKEPRGVNPMKSKNRITLTMCMNSDCSHILDCMVICKANNPNAFYFAEPEDKAGTLYCSQRNA